MHILVLMVIYHCYYIKLDNSTSLGSDQRWRICTDQEDAGVEMKSHLLLTLIIISIMISCDESIDDITAKPVVKKTSVNYNLESFSSFFPDTISLQNMSEAYSNNYSEDLREQLNEYMKDKVTEFGEDVNIFDNILSQTGCKLTGVYVIPTYAEKATFENQEAWLFQVANGKGVPSFSHYKCFAFGIENLDTLAFMRCR